MAHRSTSEVPVGATPLAGDELPGTSPRRRWPIVLASLLALLAVVVTAVVVLTGGDDDEGGGTSPTSPPSVPPTSSGDATSDRLTRADWNGTAVGVFRSTSEERVAAYEEWLGRPIDVVVDMAARANWHDVSSPDYLLEEWEGTGRRLVLGVPMLPTDVEASIEVGAQGEYDQYFRTLGEKLVAYGHEDAILRIGWEFNLEGWPWYSEDPQSWVTFWRRIVDQFEQVPGAEFRYDWNVNNGGPAEPDPRAFYPGDEYVDYVGVDAYDVAGRESMYPIPADCRGECARERQETAWADQIYGGRYGLEFWSDFAAEHDKQLSLPEWGIWERFDGIGGGDNPYYIERMAEFIADPGNRVGYQSYFEDANSQGSHLLMVDDEFPEARDRYLELFGAES